MTVVQDENELRCSGASRAAMEAFTQAMHQFQCYVEDPVATVDRAIDAAPGFVMAHTLRAYLHLLGTEPGDIAVARASAEVAARLGGDVRERAHAVAIDHLLKGHWRAAGRVLEDIAIDYPRDIVVLQAGHLVDFYTGNARMLRDRIARALPAWSADMPTYHAVLGMYAFGLEETGNYSLAEQMGRTAVSLNPRDGWAQHAVAHVLEMQNLPREGIPWMRDDPAAWATDSFLQVHNWWHLALFHLEVGEIDTVLELFDGPIHGERSPLTLDLVDASALLWRLHLHGVDVGDRWQSVADGWVPLANTGTYAFNDVHAAMAFAGSGRDDAIEAILETQRAVIARDDDNAMFTRDVGHPLTRAIWAFGAGDFRTSVELIRPLREIAHRFGGSHAQRDVIDLTLIEAAFRAGKRTLARALTAEREAMRPESPLSLRFSKRAGALRAAA